MDAHIRYQSIYSSSKEYAEKLAELLTMQTYPHKHSTLTIRCLSTTNPW